MRTNSSSGSVSIRTTRTIEAGDNAIEADATTSNVKVQIENTSALAAGGDAININTGGGVTIDQEGDIESTGGSGINIAASSSVDIEAQAEIAAAQSAIIANSSGDIDITVENTAPLTATAGDGVFASSSGGSVDLELHNTRIRAGEDGVDVLGATDVTVAGLDGDLSLTAGRDGIRAGSTGGTVTVINKTRLNVGRDGIAVTGTGGAGTSVVRSDEDINAPRNAIFGENVTGALEVTANGALRAGSGAAPGRAIDISGTGPQLTIVAKSAASSGNSDAIRGAMAGGRVAITADGPVTALAAGARGIVVGNGVVGDAATAVVDLGSRLQSATSAFDVTTTTSARINVHKGAVVTATDDFAIRARGGAATVNNDGTITGFVDLTDNADVVNNNSSNTWFTHTAGTTGSTWNFNAGNDVYNNFGRTVAAQSSTIVETVVFNSLEEFNNGDPTRVEVGLLTLLDGGLNDTLSTSGNFTGVGNSTFAIDAFLGPPGSTADRLNVGGNTNGATAVVVNNLNPGPGSYNPVGIPVVVVTGNTAASHFFLANGPIDRGMFTYDLFLRSTTHLLASVPDQEAHEMPRLVSAVQGLWQDSSGVLADHEDERRDQMARGCRIDDIEKRADCTPLWARAFGTYSQREDSDQFTLLNKTFTFDTSYSQANWGTFGGMDGGGQGIFGQEDKMLAGAFGGFIGSRITFDSDSSTTSAEVTGWSAGAHVAYLADVFFMDVLGKYDQYDLDYTAAALGNFGSTDTSRISITGGRANLGLRLNVGNSTVIEPLATVSYATTTMSEVALAGSTIDYAPDDSLRARGGLRTSGILGDAGNWRFSGSLTGSYWHEFLADNHATILSAGPAVTLTDNFSGGFGEVGGEFNSAQLSGGWSGHTKFDYLFGNGIQTGRLTVGQKYTW